MVTNVGDHIIVESEAVGQPTRDGEILEIIRGEVSVSYRVRWQDGHETIFTPSGGSAKFVPAKRKPKAKAASKR